MLQKRQVAIQPIPFNGNFWSCVNDETNFNVYKSPRLSDKNRNTWSWFVTYITLRNSPSYSQSQPLSNHCLKEVTKKKLTYGMMSWVSNYFEILDFKLVWFCHYVQTALYWYFNLMRKLLCLFSEMYLTLPEYSILNYLY